MYVFHVHVLCLYPSLLGFLVLGPNLMQTLTLTLSSLTLTLTLTLSSLTLTLQSPQPINITPQQLDTSISPPVTTSP